MIGSLILSITSGLLLSLAFPPWNADLAAWIAITPLLTAMQREKALHRAAICGFFFGFAFFLIDLRWIVETMVSHGKFSTITAILVSSPWFLLWPSYRAFSRFSVFSSLIEALTSSLSPQSHGLRLNTSELTFLPASPGIALAIRRPTV